MTCKSRPRIWLQRGLWRCAYVRGTRHVAIGLSQKEAYWIWRLDTLSAEFATEQWKGI